MISPLVLTYNEEPNLSRTLAALDWAAEVLVLDSFSDDRTTAIAETFPNVRVLKRRFDDFASQFAAGAAACKTNWVLALDADYVLSDELVSELAQWAPSSGIDAYYAQFIYCIHGKALRASLYPPRAVLFNRSRCQYEQQGHHQVLKCDTRFGWLAGAIRHDDRKPLSRWLLDQDRYAQQEASRLSEMPDERLNWADWWRRKIIAAPFLVFVATLLWRGLLFDGWHGWYYVCQRTFAELLLSLRLVERKLQGDL